MGKETSIAWADHTFNPWWGCTEVSPGCDNCYAKTWDHRVGGAHWGTGAPRRTFSDKHWNEPLAWNRAAEEALTSATVFCMSMGDIMDPEAPAGARERTWALIDATPWLTWLLLTKRPQLYERFTPALGFKHNNVRLGATTENQELYDLRIGPLCAAARHLAERNARLTGKYGRVRTFASYEPALGPITMRDREEPDQVIFGGETGSDAARRPMSAKWAEDMRDECKNRRVAFFMKQMSARTPKAAEALIPVDLLIRQQPGSAD